MAILSGDVDVVEGSCLIPIDGNFLKIEIIELSKMAYLMGYGCC